jgi:putative selenium metabolism protein SsnA
MKVDQPQKYYHFARGTLVLPGPRLEQADLWVDQGQIVAVGEPPAGDRPAAQRIDCEGCLLLPGIVCGHGHLYSSLATGMPAPCEPPTSFVEILERVWWRLDEALDEESLRASALVGALGAIRSGTTTIIDHHASPNFIDGSLDVIGDALERVGLRSLLCYEVTDRGGASRRQAGLRENERFLASSRPLARGMVGAHASFTLEPATLDACADLARRGNTGLHVHLAEDQADQRDALERYGCTVLTRLADADALSQRTLLAHGVHLTEQERAMLADSPAWIAHNPRSNMNNSVGYARPQTLGPRVILGTDGIGADMFAESQFAFFRAREQELAADAATVWRWLTQGAELVSDLFGSSLGTFAVGARADVVVLDQPLATPMTEGSVPWHWIFALSSRAVRDVAVDGRLVLRDRRFPHLDEEGILRQARELAPSLWARL